MGKNDRLSVSVGINPETLEKLQLIAHVSRRTVGDLIREGVDDLVKKLSASEEFRKNARRLRERYSETLIELLQASTQKKQPSDLGTANTGKVVHLHNKRPRRKK